LDRPIRPCTDREPALQDGILYGTPVNALCEEIPASVGRIIANAVAVEASADRQRIVLSNDQPISACLVVLANGLNASLRHMLGITCRIESPAHSISIGCWARFGCRQGAVSSTGSA
jgi:2-polyprenyl-6-methoxyphenol hydroxylase-like FAD-dependent oxidoreductase